MKKLLLTLATVFLAITASAESAKWDFKIGKNSFNSGMTLKQKDTSSAGSWTFTYTGASSTQNDGTNGPRFGSADAPLITAVLSLSSSDIPQNATITGVTFTVKGNAKTSASSWNLLINNAQVGEAQTASGINPITMTWSNLNVAFGDVAFELAEKATGGLHLQGVSITYKTGPQKEDACLAFPQESYSVNLGETFQSPVLTNPNGLAVTYASDKAEVATVDATSGNVKIVGAGTTKISATSKETEKFAAGTASYTLTVTKTNIGLKYSAENAECDITKLAEFVAPVLSFGEGYENVPVVYSSENENVATVTDDGKVNILAKGTTVITAAVASDNANYEGSASYTLKVIDPNAPDPALINAADLSELKPDKNVTAQGYTFSVKTNSGSNAPTYNQNNNDYRVYAKGSLNITAPENLQITKVEFTLSSQGKSRYPDITCNPVNGTQQTKEESVFTWTGNADNVTFTVGDKAIYSSDASNNGQLCFDNVKITYIYKPAKEPVVSHNKNQVTITHEEEGAKIYYTVDGSDVDVTKATLYKAPFAIDKNTTVKAVAVVEGKANSAQHVYEAEYIAAPTATWESTNTTVEHHQSGVLNASTMSLDGIHGGIIITITAPKGCALWYSLTQGESNPITKAPVMKANQDKDFTAVDVPLTKVESGKVENVLVQKQGKLTYYTENADGKQSHDVVVNFTGETGVEDIIADENNGEVEFFNLQGVRVANPENGVYIRRQGNKATKVLVK